MRTIEVGRCVLRLFSCAFRAPSVWTPRPSFTVKRAPIFDNDFKLGLVEGRDKPSGQ
jgi:hypothetical protein